MTKKDKDIKKDTKKGKEAETEKRPLFSWLLIIILIFAILYLYARYVGPSGIKVNEYNITSGDVPESFDGFSIVQFSDLELGTTFNTENLKSLVKKINSLDPDIIVFTGDLVNKDYKLSSKKEKILINSFNKMDALIGKYSVRGDDDTRSNVYEDIIENTDFIDITNNYELIYYKGLIPIVLYGLDSLNKGNQNYDTTFAYPNDETDAAFMATYRILLAHEPDTADKVSAYNIALMLSGHSHNSDINIPYLKELYKVKGAYKYSDEKYNVGGMQLYVSSGLGSSKYKVRLLSKPSISIFRLYRD